jgi:AbiV family abortive infection protein
MLLEAGSHATAAFLAITALEETANVHIGKFRRSTEPVARRKDPLYGHAEKHRLGLGPTIAMEAACRPPLDRSACISSWRRPKPATW